MIDHQGIALPMPQEQLTRLNPFAVTLRYQDIEFVVIETDDVLEIIEMARAWVKEQIHE